jgi:hypothetical protein
MPDNRGDSGVKWYTWILLGAAALIVVGLNVVCDWAWVAGC